MDSGQLGLQGGPGGDSGEASWCASCPHPRHPAATSLGHERGSQRRGMPAPEGLWRGDRACTQIQAGPAPAVVCSLQVP